MKILIVDNAAITYRDSRYYVYKTTGEFGKELKELGHQVEYFQFSNNRTTNISFFDLKKNDINVSAVKMYSSKILSYLNAYREGFLRVMDNDFLYIYYPNSFSFLAILAVLSGKSYGLYVRGEQGVYTRKSYWLYQRASIVLTVAKGFSDKINRRLREPKAKTIKPMISFSELDIVNDREYNRRNDFKILYLGRIDRNKGLIELLRAVKILKERSKTRFTLDIVGDGGFLENVKERIMEMGIDDNVQCWGAVTDVEKIKQWYLQSDIYILPTHHEGFPRTLYEAMIFGIPIVTTFVGAISGIMRHQFNCFQIKEKSTESIVDQLESIMNNYSDTKRVTRNAIDTVKTIVEGDKPGHAEQLHQILQSMK